jgi:hypothetical protein
VLAHETADLLSVHDHATMAEFGVNTPVAIGFELVTNRFHLGNDNGVARLNGWRVIEGRAADPH